VVDSNHTSCTELGATKLEDIPTVVSVLQSGTNLRPNAVFTLRVQADTYDAHPRNFASHLANALNASEADFIIVSTDDEGEDADELGRRRRAQQLSLVRFGVTFAGDNVQRVLEELSRQLADPTSALLTDAAIGIEPGIALQFSFVCPAGMTRRPGDANCLPCPGNSIPDAANNYESCRDCVPGRAPSEDLAACVCAAGFYNQTKGAIKCYEQSESWAELPVPADDCVACDDLPCVQCTLDQVEMLPGFAVSTTIGAQHLPFEDLRGQRAVFPCSEEVCTGNIAQDCLEICTGDPVVPCTVGYGGPLCANCAPGWSRPGFRGPCNECDEVLGAVWLVFGSVLAFGSVTAVLYMVGLSGGLSTAKLGLLVTLGKIAVSMVQILTQLEFSLDLRWPITFRWLIQILKLFSLDWLGFLDFGCLMPCKSRVGSIVLRTCTIIVLIVLGLSVPV
jgi:hypothetical protein